MWPRMALLDVNTHDYPQEIRGLAAMNGSSARAGKA